MKNKYEIKDDVVMIYVNRKGYEHIVLIDKEDLGRLEMHFKNKLNIDTNGYVQHRYKENGQWYVKQVHRFLSLAFPWETIKFRNGNRLDLRKKNLYYVDRHGNEQPVA